LRKVNRGFQVGDSPPAIEPSTNSSKQWRSWNLSMRVKEWRARSLPAVMDRTEIAQVITTLFNRIAHDTLPSLR
jgi:hypothetical protein